MDYPLVKYAVMLYIVLFFAQIAFMAIKVKRETGVFPIIKNTDRVYGFVDRIVLFSYLLVIVNALTYVFDGAGIIEVLDLLYLKVIGLVVMGLSLFTIFISQLQMQKNWRIGIDDRSKIHLVKTGLFRYFRHPIYFFAILIGISTFLVFPALSTFFIAFILWISLSIQARLEEKFLIEKFGTQYKRYINGKHRFF